MAPATSPRPAAVELSPELRRKVAWFMDRTLQSLSARAGEKTKLICGHSISQAVLAELPGSSLAWTFNTEPLAMDPSRVLFYKDNLDITDLTPSDSGVYACVVTWGTEATAKQNLTLGVFSLEVESESPTRYVYEREPARLDCHSLTLGRLFPDAVRYWLYNGTHTSVLPVTKADNGTCDVIASMRKAMSGVWECQVMHQRTERVWATAWYNLSVQAPPSGAARAFRYLQVNWYTVVVILTVLLIAMLLLCCFSGYKLMKIEESVDETFLDERGGWEETLLKHNDNGTIDIARLTPPPSPAPSSSGDSDTDTGSRGGGILRKGGKTKKSGGKNKGRRKARTVARFKSSTVNEVDIEEEEEEVEEEEEEEEGYEGRGRNVGGHDEERRLDAEGSIDSDIVDRGDDESSEDNAEGVENRSYENEISYGNEEETDDDEDDDERRLGGEHTDRDFTTHARSGDIYRTGEAMTAVLEKKTKAHLRETSKVSGNRNENQSESNRKMGLKKPANSNKSRSHKERKASRLRQAILAEYWDANVVPATREDAILWLKCHSSRGRRGQERLVEKSQQPPGATPVAATERVSLSRSEPLRLARKAAVDHSDPRAREKLPVLHELAGLRGSKTDGERRSLQEQRRASLGVAKHSGTYRNLCGGFSKPCRRSEPSRATSPPRPENQGREIPRRSLELLETDGSGSSENETTWRPLPSDAGGNSVNHNTSDAGEELGGADRPTLGKWFPERQRSKFIGASGFASGGSSWGQWFWSHLPRRNNSHRRSNSLSHWLNGSVRYTALPQADFADRPSI